MRFCVKLCAGHYSVASYDKYKRYDEETETYSDDVEALTGAIADLTKTANNPRGITLFKDGDQTTYRSTYEILSDIADIWDELTDKNQAELLEKLFGKQRAQVGAAILSNFDQARASIETMADSAGSAEQEMENIYNSLEYKLNELRETWVGVAQDLVNDSLVGGAVSLMTRLSEGVQFLTSKLGFAGTMAVAVFGVKFISSLLKANNALKAMQDGLEAVDFSEDESIKVYASSLADLNEKQRQYILTNSKLSDEQKDKVEGFLDDQIKENLKSIEAIKDKIDVEHLDIAALRKLSREEIKNSLISETVSDGIAELTASIISGASGVELLKMSFKGLGKNLESLGVGLKTSFFGAISNPLVIANLVITAVSAIYNAIKEAHEEAIETANDIISTYNDAKDTFESNQKTLEGLKARFSELSDGVDANGKNISLTADEYTEFKSIIDQIVDISPDVVKGYDSEGNAVLDYKNALSEAIEAQNQYIENQRNIYLGSGEDIFDGKAAEWKDASKDMVKAANKITDFARFNRGNILLELQRAIKSAGVKDDGGTLSGLLSGELSWNDHLDQAMQIYENYDKIMVSLRENAGYTEEELNQIQTIFQGMAGSDTKLTSIVDSRANYLKEWVSTQNWYSDVPADAMAQFNEGLKTTAAYANNFDDAVAGAVKYGREFVDTFAGEGVQNIQSLASGLADGSTSLKDYNAAVDAFKNEWKGSESVLAAIINYFNALSNSAGDSTSAESVRLSKLLDDYSRVKAALDRSSAGDNLDIGEEPAKNASELRAELAGIEAEIREIAGDKSVDELLSVKSASLTAWQDTAESYTTLTDVIAKAQSDMATTGSLSVETVNALAKATDNYSDYLYTENGAIKLNIDALRQLANSKISTETNKIIEENEGYERQNDLLRLRIKYYREQQEQGSDDAIWESLISNATAKIQENTNAIIENQEKLKGYESIVSPWEGTASASNAFIEGMTQLASIQDEISDSYKISAEKALEFADVYPDILEGAKECADGQIQLSKDIVDAQIAQHQNELTGAVDAEVGALEAKRAVLQASLECIDQQIAAAESGDQATIDSANEAAATQIMLRDAVLTAAEQAGIDEETANEMALSAMTGDWDTFRELAQKAVYDLDDESALSFTNVMNNFALTAKGIVGNTNEVVKAFKNMGDAFNQAMSGEGVTTKEYKANITAGVVKGQGKKALEGVLSDMWDSQSGSNEETPGGNSGGNERTKSYLEKLQSIYDDYISENSQRIQDLRAQRETIAKQISSIDSQIAVLNSLKGRKLSSFSSNSGSGSSGGSSNKDVEEYIATIDDYREALMRLEKAEQAVADTQKAIDDEQDLFKKIQLHKQLIGTYQQQQAALHNLNNQRDSTIKAGVKSLQALGFEVKYNADTNDLWIANMEHVNELMADSKGDYDTMQEATNALRKETENLMNTLTELNEDNQNSSDTWWDLKDSIGSAREEIQSLLEDIVSNASESVDSIQNIYDTLHGAADEYAESGYITIDTLQEILGLGIQYVSYLRDENGELVINEDRIRDVIKAKTQQMAIESSMAYIEALRIAKENNEIETLNDLLYATNNATDATWGLVYANLATLDLSDDQYQAAFNNINAIRALADNACKGIDQGGKSLLDELENMKSGIDDIVQYVMDMLQQRINDQIDALEDMKDAYSEIIDMKKESLEASKDEADYQKTLASKMKQIAKIQAQIDALSLDDSRSAQAERAKLLEELAELQEDLSDTQADKTLETQKEALDKMNEEYGKEKDEEIKALEDSISSEQKLYDMAIDYIGNNWDTLYNELLDWNYQYGSVLDSEITSAWENCIAAARRYGDVITAIGSIDGDIDSIKNSDSNYKLGDTNYDGSYTNREGVTAIVDQMKENAEEWHVANASRRQYLSNDNVRLGAMLAKYGITAVRDDNGTWHIGSKTGPLLFDKYHSGGIVGGGDIKSNEKLSLLKDNEWVLSEKMVDNLSQQIDRINQLSRMVETLPAYVGKEIPIDLTKFAGETVNNVTNNNSSQPIEITFGDTIINGIGKDAAEQHIKVTRDMVNQIARILGIRR